jgi:transcriptional regulator with XRE-family HTH domain
MAIAHLNYTAGQTMKSSRASEISSKVDAMVGERIRRFRSDRGYTQGILAQALGLSYQQVQKYETGFNRVSAGRLYEIAKYLHVPIDDFFAGTDTKAAPDAKINPDTNNLIDNFRGIEDRNARAAISNLVKSLRQNAK